MIKAYATSGAGSAGGGIGGLLLPLVLMFALSYFLMIKPQKKKQQEAIQLKNSLKAGDTVILYSGLDKEFERQLFGEEDNKDDKQQ